MNENEMANREAKSVSGFCRPTSHILKRSGAVKVQRIYGSWCNVNTLCLRFILMGLERDYQVKVLSKQIARYSTNNSSLD